MPECAIINFAHCENMMKNLMCEARMSHKKGICEARTQQKIECGRPEHDSNARTRQKIECLMPECHIKEECVIPECDKKKNV